MMHVALGFWVLSAVVFLGKGDHHEGHEHHHKGKGHHHEGHEHQHEGHGRHTEGHEHHHEGHGRPHKGHGHHHHEPHGNNSMVSSANKDFSFDLYKRLAAVPDSQGKNIFFSPFSISQALAALSVGARGQTHQQIFRGLRFNSSLTQASVNSAFKSFLTTPHDDRSAGTAVFVHNTFKPEPEFLETLKQSYMADGFTVDFTKPTESANTINKYVSDKTLGKIDKLVEDLDPATLMYLISYIYFKGTWKKTFNPNDTHEEMFNVDEQNQVPVQMMYQENQFSVYRDQGINASVLHLPFNTSTSMLLVLPDKKLDGVEEAICQNHVNKWLKWMKIRKYQIHVPKFSIKASYSLKDVLSEMGMQDMFGISANLSGISEGLQLAVSEVVHKATLDVDEAGATATAATGVGIMLMSIRNVPVLKFTRPFMVILTESSTGNILFMGRIVNPNI